MESQPATMKPHDILENKYWTTNLNMRNGTVKLNLQTKA